MLKDAIVTDRRKAAAYATSSNDIVLDVLVVVLGSLVVEDWLDELDCELVVE